MLLDAARRTPGSLTRPPPFVRQTAAWRLLAGLRGQCPVRNDADDPGGIYSALHANIQDVFAEQGMQIMTPHYVADPKPEKIPPVSGRSTPGRQAVRRIGSGAEIIRPAACRGAGRSAAGSRRGRRRRTGAGRARWRRGGTISPRARAGAGSGAGGVRRERGDRGDADWRLRPRPKGRAAGAWPWSKVRPLPISSSISSASPRAR